MTPLAILEKSANASFYNPYQPASATNVARSAGKAVTQPKAPGGFLNTMPGAALDLGISFIPGVGALWNGGKAIYSLAKGNYGQAAENLAYAGLGLLPGAGAMAKGVGMIGRAGARAAATGGRLGRAAQKAQQVGNRYNAFKATGRTLVDQGTRVGFKTPYLGYTMQSPFTTGGAKVMAGNLGVVTGAGALGASEMANPVAAKEQSQYELAMSRANPAPLDPNASFADRMASLTAGGGP